MGYDNILNRSSKKSLLHPELNPWYSGGSWVFDPLSHIDFLNRDLLSFAFVKHDQDDIMPR
jgi:hypothetical protein